MHCHHRILICDLLTWVSVLREHLADPTSRCYILPYIKGVELSGKAGWALISIEHGDADVGRCQGRPTTTITGCHRQPVLSGVGR